MSVTFTVADKEANRGSVALPYLIAPGPPPPSGPVYGTSFGTDAAWSVANLKPNIVRTYTPGNLAQIPKGMRAMHSRKTNLAALRAGTIQPDVDEFGKLEDIDGMYGCIWHEGDKDGLVLADYQGAWANFQTKVIPAVNAKRQHPIRTIAIVTGVALAKGTIGQYLVPEADEWGVDIYTAANIKPNAAWIAVNGNKPWWVPEMGYVAGGAPGDGNDAQKLARLKSDVATYLGLPNPPKGIITFNNNGSYLGPNPLMPQSVAWWANLSVTGKPS